MSDHEQTVLEIGHEPDDPRCPVRIDRVITKVREELEKIYADRGEPSAVTVLVNFNDHVSHRVFSVPMFWECVATASGKDEVRDEYGDRCDRDCAWGERPDLIEAKEEARSEAVISNV
jgi:hypothetical protein